MLDDLTREEKVFISILYIAEGLERKGFIKIDGPHLTEKGKHIAKRLKESGFKTTNEEREEFVKFVTR